MWSLFLSTWTLLTHNLGHIWTIMKRVTQTRNSRTCRCDGYMDYLPSGHLPKWQKNLEKEKKNNYKNNKLFTNMWKGGHAQPHHRRNNNKNYKHKHHWQQPPLTHQQQPQSQPQPQRQPKHHQQANAKRQRQHQQHKTSSNTKTPPTTKVKTHEHH